MGKSFNNIDDNRIIKIDTIDINLNSVVYSYRGIAGEVLNDKDNHPMQFNYVMTGVNLLSQMETEGGISQSKVYAWLYDEIDVETGERRIPIDFILSDDIQNFIGANFTEPRYIRLFFKDDLAAEATRNMNVSLADGIRWKEFYDIIKAKVLENDGMSSNEKIIKNYNQTSIIYIKEVSETDAPIIQPLINLGRIKTQEKQ